MDVLVLGNGFDLAHQLPTTYQCFLETIKFLMSPKASKTELTIGNIFECTQDKCSAMGRGYLAYKQAYDRLSLPRDKISKLIECCGKNCWWHYFSECYTEEHKWIDFENEISKVIKGITCFIDKYSSTQCSFRISRSDSTFVKYFHFFLDPYSSEDCPFHSIYEIPIKYVETFANPDYSVNMRKIAQVLYQKLDDFSSILSQYFDLFVDNTIKQIKKLNLIQKNINFASFDDVITYNYTRSFELIYEKQIVAHIHGTIGKKIILGINSNTDDEIERNLTFVDFKKYYQRVVYGTDLDYLNILLKMKESLKKGQTVTLSIVGHSLDDTDKDSISELFESSNQIQIFYHDEAKIPEFVQKLIIHFGKTKFDELRFDRQLRFLPLNELTGPPPAVTVFKRFI